jgi:hypothetical protein
MFMNTSGMYCLNVKNVLLECKDWFVTLQAIKRNTEERLSEMAKEFGATSFEETSEEMASTEERGTPLASKQHVKRLISGEQTEELETYQGTLYSGNSFSYCLS